MSKSWTSTLRLPKSTFPPRPLPQLRDQYLQRCTDSFYKWQAANRPADDQFVLHDGPPYANGSLHVGHALNKVLKDIILRVKVQQGRRVKYVPGWDCHGLPIELKALGTSGGKNMTPLEIRQSARDLATRTVLEQMKGFKSFAVMADWEGRWLTLDRSFEIKQLRLFQKMVHRGLIYRKYKPVYWSPSSGTALAEAELEYNDEHVSTAAFVRFPILDGRGAAATKGIFKEPFVGQLFAVIWTTTPWTLPANKAIAVHDNLEYSIVKHGTDALIIATSLLEAVSKVCFDGAQLEVIGGPILGRQLRDLTYRNPLQGRNALPQPIIHADFVSAESGTGLVHCAPGHGFDDYEVCTPLGIPVTAPVDNEGLFTADAYPDDPECLTGASVQGEGNKAVLSLLGNNLLGVHEYKHKYPYDWRTKKPIIIRATAQWFADVASIKDHALKALEEVQFIPDTGRNRLEAFVRGRSEWCISRQRAWGVPIPALYSNGGEAVMTEESVQHITSVIEERGTDAWWSDDEHDPAWVHHSLRGKGDLRRGKDTMDVWFDSGSSWTQLNTQADVYLEGTDQHRGWFQSSLLTRVAALDTQQTETLVSQPVGLSPYKNLITHGFTLDQEGKKMSKSLGNIISPDQVMDGTLLPPVKAKKKGGKTPPVTHDALGSDALRLWVSSSDYTRDVVIGEPVLKSIHTALLKYRTIIKMLLGSMHEAARTNPLTTVDHIALIQLKDTMEEVAKAYNNYEFYKGFSSVNRWINNDLSAFYLEALKDRLYCGDGGGVLEPIFIGFLRMLAPVTPVLVEEAWGHSPDWLTSDPSVLHPLQQLYTSPLVDPTRLSHDEAELREAIPVLMSAHAAIKSASELARGAKVLGSSLQCSVVLEVPDRGISSTLKKFEDELEAMFVVSAVDINGPVAEQEWHFSETFQVGSVDCKAWILPPKQSKCPRCWRYVAPEEDALCHRCEEAVSGL